MLQRIFATIANLAVVAIAIAVMGAAAMFVLRTDFNPIAPTFERAAPSADTLADTPAVSAAAVSAAPTAVRIARPTRCRGEIWGLPVRADGYRITAKFGFKSANSAYTQGLVASGGVQTGTQGVFHPGVDLAADTGDPIYAVTAGRVINVAYTDQYGKHIVIEDGENRVLFGHLSQQFVQKGDQVWCGQLIGLAGGTGKALTGPHLHIEMRQLGSEKPVNPLTRIESAYVAMADAATDQAKVDDRSSGTGGARRP